MPLSVKILKVLGNIRLGQADGGDQFSHIYLPISDDQYQLETADFRQVAKGRGYQTNICFGAGLKCRFFLAW
jgi:hypothetical protein